MKDYTLEQIELLMKAGQPIDMNRVSMKALNKVAYQYMKDCEKGETKAREMYLKTLNTDNCDPLQAVAWLQLYDFAKNSKEGVLFNWSKTTQTFKQYNENLNNKKISKS